MVHHLAKQHSILSNWIHDIRNTDTQNYRMRFRKNLERIGEVMAYELSKTLPYVQKEIETPLGTYQANVLQEQPVLATILRAGIPLYQGLLNFFDEADSAFIAAYRKHNKLDDSFEINQGYVTCPSLENRTLILADPMLATSSSLVVALDELFEYGQPREVHIVCVIACTEGLDTLRHRFPDITIWAADIDDELTAKGYIVPGLGVAGDLCFGSKMQF